MRRSSAGETAANGARIDSSIVRTIEGTQGGCDQLRSAGSTVTPALTGRNSRERFKRVRVERESGLFVAHVWRSRGRVVAHLQRSRRNTCDLRSLDSTRRPRRFTQTPLNQTSSYPRAPAL